MASPVIADHGDEVRRDIGSEIAQSAVATRIAELLSGHGFPGTISRDHRQNRPFLPSVGCEGGKALSILRQDLVQYGVC